MLSAYSEIIYKATYIVVIFCAILLSFLSSKTIFVLQFTALLIVLYIIADFMAKKTKLLTENKRFIDIFFLTSVVFLVIFSSGGLYSPLFFLIYFLLFGVSLLFEPSTGILLSIFASVFLLLLPRKEILYEFLQLASLFLIAPLSTIFGSQYKKLKVDEEKIKILTKEEQVIQKSSLITEGNIKKWTENELRNRLGGIWKDLDTLVQQASNGTPYVEKYQKLKSEIVDLLKSAQGLEKKVSQRP